MGGADKQQKGSWGAQADDEDAEGSSGEGEDEEGAEPSGRAKRGDGVDMEVTFMPGAHGGGRHSCRSTHTHTHMFTCAQ